MFGGISMLATTDASMLEPGLARLDHDLASGHWHRQHADLLERDALACWLLHSHHRTMNERHSDESNDVPKCQRRAGDRSEI